MGPKRKLGPKSRRRRKEETPSSSSEDETETADTNRILLAEKLDPDYEKEEEVRSNIILSVIKRNNQRRPSAACPSPVSRWLAADWPLLRRWKAEILSFCK